MSGDEVRKARIALSNEIDRIDGMVKGFKYQEAEASLLKIDVLYSDLIKLLDTRIETHNNIRLRCKIKMNMLTQSVEKGLEKRDAGKKEDGNIAFKCNWNDMNYRGICSKTAYQYNQLYGGPWCLYSRCRQFINLPTPPLDCCYESRALIDCNFGAGWDHGPNGEPIYPRTIRSVRKGKIALLTTEPPNMYQRFVVGVFRITRLEEDPGKETFIFGDQETMLNDMLQFNIRFWDYHKNPNNPNSYAWSTGLFRYVSDIAVLGILESYIDKKTKIGGDISKAQKLVLALMNSKK